ncbi:ABC transporter ATP-binding protein [Litorihabitans aurantiacus]|uniref:Peptide ABC transporter ATP-binding protein n=1 Tax=Litorihabitans aurantiacus TaxID=1930061 RepID=A0AA38CVI3_9MICO|nr:ATP-binding cassette domain-containing protein [Litorihabitans aurantiacus]GMA32427.1 peptide ABC transporter ATP-binding protein [Litorihabitans aurantiacus]
MAQAGEAIIVASALHTGYDGQEVLHGVDLTIGAREPAVGIVGPSGAGKSTLVRALVGLRPPYAGTATYRGRTVSKLRRGDKKEFAGAVRRVSQDGVPTSDPRLTVEKYLTAALKEARRAGRTHASTPEGLLEFVALEQHFLPRTVRTMSGGERQRLALAHALATRPDVLILDEPLTAIDPGLRSEILRRLKTLTTDLGISVLLVSHDLESVERLCSRVHVLADGVIVATGPLSQLLAAPDHPVVADLAAAAPLTAQRLR